MSGAGARGRRRACASRIALAVGARVRSGMGPWIAARIGSRAASWRRVRTWGAAAFGAAALLAGLRLWPAPPLADEAPHSAALFAQGGELLRLALAPDEQYRLWVPLERMAPALPEAVRLYEDRWFYWHPGANPAALLRSAWGTWTGGTRQGGSTITMQLARRLYRIDSRSIAGKLRQIGAALWLEARYSKHDLLEAYLNLAPYGGNIEGVGAASLIYFHKRAHDLALPEALALAVIPQNPRKRLAAGGAAAASGAAGARAVPAELAEARARLWDAWRARHPADARYAADFALPLKVYAARDLPWRAPHFADGLLAEGVRGEVATSIDLRMQDTVERMIRQTIERERAWGLRNAAALLVDTQTMEVRALAGSADWFDPAIDGQVDGTAAKRSPGSTLKPFVYALALDQGVLHPLTVLKDAPTAFGPFSPENFDGRFIGPVTAQDALVRSRNVPAVAVAARLKSPTLYEFLRAAGVARMASETHYGLSLVLGGGEVTMRELARLYAVLANRGVLKPLRTRASETDAPAAPAPEAPRLLSEEAAYITLDMLRRNPRPDTGAPASAPVAWKTGTSWGFRDAWTAGVFGRLALVVWIGNFDGAANPAFVGVQAAAPLFFRIVDALRGQHLEPPETIARMPANLARVDVCAASGDLPNAWCKERAATWFIPGVSPIRTSTLHRPLVIDARTGRAVCAENAHTRVEVYEYWPSDLQRLFREAGMPRRQPPPAPDCPDGAPALLASGAAANADGDAPQIVSPLRGVRYTQRLSRPVPIALRANRGAGGALFWFADQAFLGRADAGAALAWTPPRAGRYMLRAVDENGRSDAREVEVEFVP